MVAPVTQSPLSDGLLSRALLQHRRRRCLSAPEGSLFLHDHAGRVLSDRLQDIKRDFPHILQIGARDPLDWTHAIKTHAGGQVITRMDMIPDLLQAGDMQGDEEILPFSKGMLDMVISNLNLHSVNDLPGALIQIRHALKNDGVFIASMFGGETLRELRESLLQAELSVSGGAHPRVMPFADKPQMGDLLSRAGFNLPVVDSEIVTVSYEHIFKLMHDLRYMGEASIIKDQAKHFTKRDIFMRAADYYHAHFAEPDGRIYASFEIIYLIGWSPDESQQKPLKPGSAKIRLADALGAQEKKL